MHVTGNSRHILPRAPEDHGVAGFSDDPQHRQDNGVGTCWPGSSRAPEADEAMAAYEEVIGLLRCPQVSLQLIELGDVKKYHSLPQPLNLAPTYIHLSPYISRLLTVDKTNPPPAIWSQKVPPRVHFFLWLLDKKKQNSD